MKDNYEVDVVIFGSIQGLFMLLSFGFNSICLASKIFEMDFKIVSKEYYWAASLNLTMGHVQIGVID